MKLVIQRVLRASVQVENEIVGKIGPGLLLLLGIERGDTEAQARQLGTKVMKLRLWPDLKDPCKQWSSNVVDNGYEILVVSQFTLFATFKKPKPDFHQALGGDRAREIYEVFVQQCCKDATSPKHVAEGLFGALMKVDLCNDGPVTVELLAEATEDVSAMVDPRCTGKRGGDSAATTSRGADSAATTSSGGALKCEGDDEGSLEAVLENQPYVGGYHPSQRDLELFERWRAAGSTAPRTPNLTRWFEHIASFAVRERDQWPPS